MQKIKEILNVIANTEIVNLVISGKNQLKRLSSRNSKPVNLIPYAAISK